MRREEVCALKVKDVKRDTGVWYIDLRNADFKRKTLGSHRYVPIHQALLGIGIIENLIAGREDQEYLFPDLKPSTLHKKHGDPFTKWFMSYRRKFKLYEEKIGFHAFRHTVSTQLLNAEAYRPWIEEIIGHESNERHSELDRYNKGILLKNLKKTVDLVDYGLDLSHLHREEPPRE